MKRLAPLLLLPLVGCIAPEPNAFSKLRPGTWVEARGHIVDGKPIVEKIEELARGESDKADKVEVNGPTTKATTTELDLLGVSLQPDAETEYEDADKKSIDPFVPEAGEWLRLKLRSKDDQLRLRTVRKSEARDLFKVTGEIAAIDAENSTINIGGIHLPLTESANVAALGERGGSDPLALFQADDQKAVPFSVQVNDNLRLGGGVSGGLEFDDEYDLTRTVQRDRTKTALDGKLDALWLFDDNASYAMFEVNTGRADTMSLSGPDTHREALQVARAFGSLHVANHLQLLLGRQDFSEERKWLYNEVLDGVRLMYVDGDFETDAGTSVGRQVAAENNATEDTVLFNLNVRYHLDTDWVLAGYALKRRDDTIFDHEPQLFGIRSLADPRYGLGHWGELSFARGHSQFGVNAAGVNSSRLDAVEDIHGWAFDIGAMYTIRGALRPAFAIGYAFASGEKDSSTHQGYRQSGYQDNSDKFGGVTSVRYYGELFRPELTNLAVFTAAATVRPFADASISLVYHTFTQDFANQQGPFNDLRFSSSGSAPNGRDPHLGDEIDIIFGYRAARQVTLEVAGSHFEPGPAFNNQDAANKLDFTARFSF